MTRPHRRERTLTATNLPLGFEITIGLIILVAILIGVMFATAFIPDEPEPEPDAPRLRLLRDDPRPYDWARSCEYLEGDR